MLPTVSTEAMRVAVAAFARDEGMDATHRAGLVLDQAGWHTSADRVLPDGIDLVFLPASSPERHPAERLWALGDEPIATRAFADRDALEVGCWWSAAGASRPIPPASKPTPDSIGGPKSHAQRAHRDYPVSV